MTWHVDPLAFSILQGGSTNCGPASVEIVLSALGRKTDPDAVQGILNGSINTWTGPFGKGNSNPAGVALTINRYAPALSSESQRAHQVHFSATPYDACAKMVNALRAYKSPAVAMVYQGTHWVVVVGAHGDGIPHANNDYGIAGLWVCNPAIPMKVEHVTYRAWLYEYFTGCAQYAIDQFVVVADVRAASVGALHLPSPEPLPGLPTMPPIDPAQSAIRGLAEYGLSDMIISDVPVKFAGVRNPLPVSAPPGQGFLPFYLVAFEGQADITGAPTWTVVRVDATWGTYLGTAIGVQAGSPLSPSFKLLLDNEFVASCEPESQRRRDALFQSDRKIRETLMWQPSNASLSPYAPFLKVDAGTDALYLTLDGRVLTELTAPFTSGG